MCFPEAQNALLKQLLEASGVADACKAALQGRPSGNLTSEVQLPPNSVRSLFIYPFARRTMKEKIRVKELGPDKPDLIISQQTEEKYKAYNQSFCRSWFMRKSWLTGCGIANVLFCFPCILFKCDLTWTQSGQTDSKHLFERIKKHERS
ncbi:hypothetical protein PAMP_010644 [Pampus punctatissimus]